MCVFYSSLLHAEPNSVPQAYALSDSLKLQENVPGINLIGGQITHSQALISGKLPYVMSYLGSVRNNLSASNDYFDQFLTTGGWTDNYQNSVRFYSYGGSATQGYYAIRLPGSRQDVWLRNINRSICSGGVQRAFSSDVIGNLAYGTGANIVWACSTNGYQFSEGVNGGIIINYRGIKYATTVASITQSGTRYYRIASAIQPQGSKLTFSYDAQLNMLSVADNRNNKLDFSRDYKAGMIQTNLEKRLISKVELTSGVGAKQNATLTYDSYNSQDANGSNGSIYYPVTATSTMAGKSTFDYTPFKQWGIDGYLTSKGTTITNTNAAILTSVKDAADIVRRQWLVTQNYSSYVASTKTYNTAKLTLQVRSPIGGGFANDYTVNYDDNARTVILTTKPNGVDVGTVTYTITPKPVSKTSDTGITYIDDGESEISVNGTFPALSIDGKMPKTVNVHSWYGYIKKAVMVNNLTLTQILDGSARLVNTTYSAPSLPTQTTTYTYGKLSDNSDNNYAIPTQITAPNLVVTQIVNSRGQIVQQTKSSPQSGSAVQTWMNYYYDDASQPNYGLLEHTSPPRETGNVLQESIWNYYDNYGNLAVAQRWVSSNGVRVLHSTIYNNYNNAGLPSSINYPDGTTDTITYDAGFRVLQTTHGNSSASRTTKNSYDALGRMVTSTDADGLTSSYAYDDLDRLITTTYPNGNQKKIYYYQNGEINVVSLTLPNGASIENHWSGIDSNGRLIFTRAGTTEGMLSTSIGYGDNNNVTQTVTSAGIVNKWSYDALNRVTSHTDGNGNVDTKTYDDSNNNTSEIAGNSAGSNRYFKNQNILQSEQNSDFGEKRYFHDLDNNLAATHHLDRHCSHGTIDELGRSLSTNCTSATYPDPTIQVNDAYTYDQSAYGNLDKVTANNSGRGVDTNYSYDIFHQVVSKTQVNHTPATWGYPASQQTVGYTYTSAGKISSITYPSGKRVNYHYHSNGELNNIQLNNQYIVSGISYDGANRLSGFNWGTGNGVWQQWINDQGLITQIKNTAGPNYTTFTEDYNYDADGRMVKKTLASNHIFTYAYDKNSQLTKEGLPNGSTISYTYDKNGNRIALRETGNPGLNYTQADYVYSNNTGNRMQRWHTNGGGALPLGLSAQGELVTTYMGSASYDNAGRRRGEVGINFEVYFDYNHKNERTFRGGSYIDRQYAYDEDSHLIGEYDASGTMLVEYIWMGDKPIAAVYPGNRIINITTDYQNKPRSGMDAVTGQQVWYWNPDAFGVAKPVDSTTGLPNGVVINLRFPGQYYDQQSGLYYNHNRYYNPELGRYMEPDPIGLEGGLNPYAYAGSNPVNNVDPSGLDATTAFGGILYQSWQGITGNGWDYSSISGAFRDGYNGQGSFGNPLANVTWSAANDVLNFGTFGLGGAAKNSILLGVRQADNFINATRTVLPKFEEVAKASTEFSYIPKWTKKSSTQIDVNLPQSQAIANLEANGFAKTFSKDGTVSILQSGKQTYRFYPEATSIGGPSAKLSIEGVKKPVTTLRFPRP